MTKKKPNFLEATLDNYNLTVPVSCDVNTEPLKVVTKKQVLAVLKKDNVKLWKHINEKIIWEDVKFLGVYYTKITGAKKSLRVWVVRELKKDQ
jgi:hypothetical protein